MKTADTDANADVEARKKLADSVERAHRIWLRDLAEKGVSVSSELTLDGLDELVRSGIADAERVALLRSMSSPFAGVPSEELEREVEHALAEVSAARTAAQRGS